MQPSPSRGWATTRSDQTTYAGFHPRRSPMGCEAGWDASASTKKEPAPGPRAFLPPRPEPAAWSPDTGEWPPVLNKGMEERRGAACGGGWGTFRVV